MTYHRATKILVSISLLSTLSLSEKSWAQEQAGTRSNIAVSGGRSDKFETVTRGGPSASGGVWGRSQIFENRSGNTGIADAKRYVNLGHGHKNRSPGGDIGFAEISRWLSSARVGLLGNWEVAVGPLLTTADVSKGDTAGMAVEEQNPVNNGPDIWPWTEFDSRKSGNGFGVPPVYASGQNEVCETWQADGNYGGNCEIALAVLAHDNLNSRPKLAPTSGKNIPVAKAPYPARWYTGILVGNNSIAPGGRGIYLGGSDGAGEENVPKPYAPIEARYAWEHGITTTLARFKDGNAFDLGNGQAIAWRLGGHSVKLSASDSGGKKTMLLEAPADGVINIKAGTIRLIGNVNIVDNSNEQGAQLKLLNRHQGDDLNHKITVPTSVIGGSPYEDDAPSRAGAILRLSLSGGLYKIPTRTHCVRLMQSQKIASQNIVLGEPNQMNDRISIQNWGAQIKELSFSPVIEGWINGGPLNPGDELILSWDGQAHRWVHFRVR